MAGGKSQAEGIVEKLTIAIEHGVGLIKPGADLVYDGYGHLAQIGTHYDERGNPRHPLTISLPTASVTTLLGSRGHIWTLESVAPSGKAVTLALNREYPPRVLDNPVIKWKRANAGMVGQASFAVLVDANDEPWECSAYYSGDEADEERHRETCFERWDTVWGLPGDTIEEARQALVERRFLGTAYHVSDCGLLDDRPTAEGQRE